MLYLSQSSNEPAAIAESDDFKCLRIWTALHARGGAVNLGGQVADHHVVNRSQAQPQIPPGGPSNLVPKWSSS